MLNRGQLCLMDRPEVQHTRPPSRSFDEGGFCCYFHELSRKRQVQTIHEPSVHFAVQRRTTGTALLVRRPWPDVARSRKRVISVAPRPPRPAQSPTMRWGSCWRLTSVAWAATSAAASGHAAPPPAQVSPEKSWLAGAGPHESHAPGAGISKSAPSMPSSPGKASRLYWGSAA